MVTPTPSLSRTRHATAGIELGIITLDTRHELIRGNVQHAGSFGFPIAYSVVRGVEFPALMSGDPAVLLPIMESVQELQSQGVRMIVGACGSFAHYQREVALVAQVPVCLSILVQVPFVLSLLPMSQKLGIVFAREAAFTEKARHQCGITDTGRIVTIGADCLDSFAPIMDPDLPLDSDRLSRDLVCLLEDTKRAEPAIGAWLLQCSDLPPYAKAICVATNLPVFDMTALITHLHATLAPRFGA